MFTTEAWSATIDRWVNSNNTSIAAGVVTTYNISGNLANKSSGQPLSIASEKTNASLTTNADDNFIGLSNGTYGINADGSVTYYLENNATIQSVGFDGNTDYEESGTEIDSSFPYMNLLKNGTMGSEEYIQERLSLLETVAFRFYIPFNYSTSTRISPDTSGQIEWRESVVALYNLNVALYDYNPINGTKIPIGNEDIEIRVLLFPVRDTYRFTIPHEEYIVPAGHRLMLQITKPILLLGVNPRLYFNDQSSFITLTETSLEPDLNLTSQNITFIYTPEQAAEATETGDVKEGINLTINATIYNQGEAESGAFFVLFYDNNSLFYNVSMGSIAAGASANATGYWTTLVGTHNITIKADPNGDTADSDRSNNNASKFINVSAWQKYYGNITGKTFLANIVASSMKNWSWNNGTNYGYIYVVNSGVSINWSALHPLGYDKNNNLNASGQDFLEADLNLGMYAGSNNATGFERNNISELFTNTTGNNYGNVSVNITSFTVHGRTIDNVPVVNTTDMTDYTLVESANFTTGILWDDTRDNNGYYDTADKENLVFIANIRIASMGLEDTANNYEIAIPCTLNPMIAGDVDVYLELI